MTTDGSSPRSPQRLLDDPDEVVAEVLDSAAHPDDVGDLLIALLGFDATVQSLAASPDPRAGAVLLSVVSWLLL